ncbi:MAG TPA: hypothetical protein VF021_07095, partial [Longimicrobiales bacterium]
SALEDDYYQFREERYEIVGEHAGRRFRLGDRVRVQVARVNREERKIDFVVVEEEQAAGGRRRGRGSKTGRPTNKGGSKSGKGARGAKGKTRKSRAVA